MKPLLKKIILQNSELPRRKIFYSDYLLAKGYREFLITAKGHLKDTILIVMGIFSACFGLKGFLLTNHFLDGGATGISLLIYRLTDMPLSYLILLVNLPFVVLAYFVIGRFFAIKTILAISGLAICLSLISFPDVTKDSLLVAVFGGFFLGAGIGFTVRGGAVIDGTEVLAIFLGRKLSLTIGDIVTMINAIIFSAAAYLLSVEVALYSMITYLAASKTLDFIVEGIDEYVGVTIVSTHSDEIRQMIIDAMGRGVTTYTGQRGYGKKGETQAIEIVYTVITRFEISKLKIEIEKIDPNAFMVMNTVKDIKGGMVKKKRHKK